MRISDWSSDVCSSDLTSGSTRAARAMERAGETLQGIASNQLAVEGKKREEEQRRREALARVDMVNAGADYEISVDAEQAQFTQDVTAGSIQYSKAGEEWSQRLARLAAPQPPDDRSDEHTSELQTLLRLSYAVL